MKFGYQFATSLSTWKQNFAQIGGFLYFGSHFGFKMATIANRNGRDMVQHVLITPCKYPFPLKSFHFWIFTILLIFILAAILKWRHLENFKNKEHVFEWWSTFVSSFKRILCLEWIYHCLHLGYHGNDRHFEFCSTPQKLPHTTVDIPTKFHEVWWKESKKKLNLPFFISMATAANLSKRFRFFWLISFH